MKKYLLLLTAFALVAFPVASQVVQAESLGTRVQDQAGDTKTDSKKWVRKAKRKVRKATGNDSAVKDTKDAVNDARDDVSNGVDKIKRRTK